MAVIEDLQLDIPGHALNSIAPLRVQFGPTRPRCRNTDVSPPGILIATASETLSKALQEFVGSWGQTLDTVPFYKPENFPPLTAHVALRHAYYMTARERQFVRLPGHRRILRTDFQVIWHRCSDRYTFFEKTSSEIYRLGSVLCNWKGELDFSDDHLLFPPTLWDEPKLIVPDFRDRFEEKLTQHFVHARTYTGTQSVRAQIQAAFLATGQFTPTGVTTRQRQACRQLHTFNLDVKHRDAILRAAGFINNEFPRAVIVIDQPIMSEDYVLSYCEQLCSTFTAKTQEIMQSVIEDTRNDELTESDLKLVLERLAKAKRELVESHDQIEMQASAARTSISEVQRVISLLEDKQRELMYGSAFTHLFGDSNDSDDESDD